MSEKQQIQKIKQILADLGVEGRPSVAKCNEIREKLEFKREMQAIDPSNIIASSRRGFNSSRSFQRDAPSMASLDELEDAPLDLSKLGDSEA
jgi:hypothetical protein